jgi:hypothetical protein
MSLNYCGGIPEMPKADIVEIVVFPDSIKIIRGFRKGIVIHFENIRNVSLKTDEQISKDVTLTRLLALGVFAFVAKKKRKNVTNYLLIDYVSGGIDCTAVFTGDTLPKISSQLAKARQEFLSAHPPKDEPASAPSIDVYSEIEKLHDLMTKGIVTENEFNMKKSQLLGL